MDLNITNAGFEFLLLNNASVLLIVIRFKQYYCKKSLLYADIILSQSKSSQRVEFSEIIY